MTAPEETETPTTAPQRLVKVSSRKIAQKRQERVAAAATVPMAVPTVSKDVAVPDEGADENEEEKEDEDEAKYEDVAAPEEGDDRVESASDEDADDVKQEDVAAPEEGDDLSDADDEHDAAPEEGDDELNNDMEDGDEPQDDGDDYDASDEDTGGGDAAAAIEGLRGLPAPLPAPRTAPSRQRASVQVPAPKVQTQQYTSKKPETIEDLCARFPDLGDGLQFLRVNRVHPKSFQGNPIAGFVEDIHARVTMSEFVTRYGGGRYTVFVMGPKDGQEDPVVLHRLDNVCAPGWPNIDGISGEDIMMQGPRMPEAPAVQMKKIDVEEAKRREEKADRQRLEEQVRAATSTPEHVVNALKEQNTQSIQHVKEMANQQVESLKEALMAHVKDIHALGDEYKAYKARTEEELKSLRDSLVKERQKCIDDVAKSADDAKNRVREAQDLSQKQHSEEVARLREEHAKSIVAIKDEHVKLVASLEKSHKDRIDEASLRYREEVSRLNETFRTDTARITQSTSTEIDRARRDSERQEQIVRTQYEDRIKDISRNNESQLALLKDQRDAAIQGSKERYDSNEKFAKQARDMEVSTKENEINRLRVDLETLRRETEDLRKKVNKDPITFLKETKETASTLLGMVDASEANAAQEEGPFDWKKELAKAAIGVGSKLPDIAKEFAGAAQQQRATNAANAQAAQAAAQQQAQGGARGALPAARRRGVAPNPWQGTMTPVAQEVAFAPPIAPRIVMQAPVQGDGAPMPAPAAAPMPAAPVTAPPDPAAAQAAANAEQGFLQFITELENAIRGELYTPQVFAKGFVDQVGMVQAGGLLQQMPVDHFLKLVEQNAGDNSTAILSRDGKTYVKAVWAEVKSLINQAQQAMMAPAGDLHE